MKPMSSKLRHIAMFSGNTILGDGSVIMIIDPNGVAQSLGSVVTSQADADEAAETPARRGRRDRRRRCWCSAPAPPQPKAVPLVAGHAARGNRRPQDRAVERPPHGAVPRPVDAAGEHERERAREERGRPAAAGVLRRRPLDGAGGRRDRRHRRGPPRHPGRQRQSRRARLAPSSRARPPKSSTSATSCRSPSRTGSATRSSRSARRRRSLLLIDDSPFFRNMLSPVLQAAGYEVTAAASAPEALAMLKDGRAFDVVVTDIEMPEMDGFEFAEAPARRSAHRRCADHRAVLGRVGRSDRARPPGRLPRLCRQVRPAGADRGAQGADRRRSRGVTSKP